jgi:cyclopropane fatty-acyl-phospholipid synthase-like methyltransferase
MPEHPAGSIHRHPRAADGYVRALRFGWLTRFYDPLLRLVFDERRLKAELLAQARIQPGHRVLDLGCGTGTLLIMIKDACPGADVTGMDVDTEILDIALEKVRASGADVELRLGSALHPPFSPATFDRILSSLVFHHMTPEAKREALSRCYDLLKPGGELHILDWGKAQNPIMRAVFLAVQALDGFRNTSENVRGRLPALIEAAGFLAVREVRRQATIAGTLSFYAAAKGFGRPGNETHLEEGG